MIILNAEVQHLESAKVLQESQFQRNVSIRII